MKLSASSASLTSVGNGSAARDRGRRAFGSDDDDDEVVIGSWRRFVAGRGCG